ncbi:hypothetical protein [Microcoleus sp. bin38.metabat.b11b12b14.051]|uniref:hypothetical protein n=1 Tax=Microcoleus sp. bin38.metabat.b11b12b14.051 TaxID=2742709 RepID=UPI0025E0F820|nr:hypothetical protein [Microcoleus sp. bin38.metabat.b11b12b14.051]
MLTGGLLIVSLWAIEHNYQGRRKKEEGRRKKEEGRRKKNNLTFFCYQFPISQFPNLKSKI